MKDANKRHVRNALNWCL